MSKTTMPKNTVPQANTVPQTIIPARMPSLPLPLLLGHRGARAEELENSPAGFTHAQQLQPDGSTNNNGRHQRGLAGIEFDVQLTGDGHLAVFHDDTLERLCASPCRIDQLTLSELKSHRQGHSSSPYLQPIITLNELLPKLRGFSHIELEIKTHPRTCYQHLTAAVDAHMQGDLTSLPVVLTSFDSDLLACLQRHHRLKQYRRGLLIETSTCISIADMLNLAQRLGCCQVGVAQQLLTADWVRHAHQRQLSVSAWTVNDVSDMWRLIDMGVDVVITDCPSAFLHHFYTG